MSDAGDLHKRLFGHRPAKDGVAYERLAALVFAAMGWDDVVHDTVERPDGKVARHQLDVTARHPDGEVGRLLVECKDWNKTVGKGTLDALVGVRNQVGADGAAAVTTVGFKAGARAVAVDENVALVRLRPYNEEEDAGRFVERVEIKLNVSVPSIDNLSVTYDAAGDLPSRSTVQVHLGSGTSLLHRDGTPAETVEEVIAANSAPLGEEGVFERHVDFAEGRLLIAVDRTPIPLLGLGWTETVHVVEETVVTERKGQPCLVLEQLDEDGEAFRGRLFVDEHLSAWEVNDDGIIGPRRSLLPPQEAEPAE
ncbi:MAG: restriction endonuclease [Actinomycetota bacterium]|nr:restriction endonuclease [Actinomycetota bacterium]